jgi:hypothetical protein
MFGSPLKTGHFFLASAHNIAGQSAGFLGIDGVHLDSLAAHLFDPSMGLTLLMPWLALGLAVGLPRLLRRPIGQLPLWLTRSLAAIVLVYLLFVATLGNYRVMNGWSVGPRYLLPAVLPMTFVAGVGWLRLARWRLVPGRLFAGLAAASVIILVALTAVFPSPPPSVLNPFGELAAALLPEGYAVRNLAMGLGSASLWLLGALTALAAGWVALGGDVGDAVAAATRPDPRPRLAAAGWAVVVALVWVFALGHWRPTDAPVRAKAQAFCKRVGEGVRPAPRAPGPRGP